jgi:hypothetical protein
MSDIARPLTRILAVVSAIACDLCGAQPHIMCGIGTVHVVRIRDAYKLERISAGDAREVLSAAVVFTNAALLGAGGPVQAAAS